jgi:hypothetical protein
MSLFMAMVRVHVRRWGPREGRIEALGVSLTLHPSAEAQRYGWAEAFGHGPLEVPLAGSISRYGRGERTRTSDLRLPV